MCIQHEYFLLKFVEIITQKLNTSKYYINYKLIIKILLYWLLTNEFVDLYGAHEQDNK